MVLRLNFNKIFRILVVVPVLLFSFSTYAEVMFEGYYLIKNAGVTIGYTVQSYEFDAKKKIFTSVYYIKTNALGGNITESLKAKSTDKFKPISYQYTAQVGETIKTIDANFMGNKMTAVVSDGKKANTVKKTLPKGSFLSTFLGYLMLSKGLSKGKKFTYSAVAEEDAEIYSGQTLIEDNFTYARVEGYRVLNEFKGTKFISYMSHTGEVLATKSPVQQISTELTPTSAEATKGFRLDAKTLRVLFGRVPAGKINQLNKLKQKESAPLPAQKTIKKGK